MSLHKASSAEKNDAKIIKFGWVILILCPFLEIQSFQIWLDFCDGWAKNCVWKSLPYGVLWKPIDPCFLCCHSDQWASTKYLMAGFSRLQFFAHRSQKSSEIWKWLYFKKMGIESNLLNQIQWSWYHSLLRKMLCLIMLKNITLLARKVLKIRRSPFYGTPGIQFWISCVDYLLLWNIYEEIIIHSPCMWFDISYCFSFWSLTSPWLFCIFQHTFQNCYLSFFLWKKLILFHLVCKFQGHNF